MTNLSSSNNGTPLMSISKANFNGNFHGGKFICQHLQSYWSKLQDLLVKIAKCISSNFFTPLDCQYSVISQ